MYLQVPHHQSYSSSNIYLTIHFLVLDEVKSAERVLVDEIPLPDLPVSAPVAPYDIPLPQPKSILKKAAAHHTQAEYVMIYVQIAIQTCTVGH